MIKDMTIGNPSKIIIGYSMPLILSGMFQQFYNIADSLIAGRFAGVDALAAVGASYPITMLFVAVAIGAGMGCSIVIAQLFGAKELGKMKTASSTAILSMLALSILLTILGLLINNSLMKLMNTPENVFAEGALYLRIYFAGLVFLFMYNISNAIFNALGDSKTPLYFLIFSSVFNVVLDYIFVAKFHMGVAGVAWATFIAQGISSVLALTTVIRRIKAIETLEITKRFDKELLKSMGHIAIPSIFQQSVVSIGQLMVQSLVNSYGSTVIAGYAAAIKIDSFLKMVIQSMSNGVSSFTAQNAGAHKLDRIKQGYMATIKMSILYSILVGILIRFTGSTMISWFVNDSAMTEAGAQVIAVGTTYLNVVSMFYTACAILLVSCGLMRGASFMPGFTIATFVDLVIRVSVAYVLAYFLGYNSIWWSIVIGWIIGMLIALLFVFRGKWKEKWEKDWGSSIC